MKILHVLLSRGFAGSERSTAESCSAQAAAGHAVMLAVRRSHRGPTGASVLDHLDRRVQVSVLPDRLFTGRALARAMAAFGPDIVHCHLRRGTRLTAAIDPPAALVATLHLDFNSRAYGAMDGLICNARWQLRELPASYRGLTFKAHNSLLPHRRLDAAERAAVRAGLGAGPDDFLVGGAGRLTRKKGWDMLIDAFRAGDLPSGARLVLFGAGSAEGALRRRAGNDPRIRFGGWRSDLKDVYQALDLFVCPSRFEPLPRVMLEALDAGVPVVASDADGCRELVEDYGGELFTREDVPALTALLERHARARPSRHRPDLSAHHLDNAMAAMLAFYGQVIERKRGGARAA
jgi:glycosyltransferase involved in cell wall biosynthesis